MSRDHDEKVDNFFKYFEIPELQNVHLLHQTNQSSTDHDDDGKDETKEEIDGELSQAIAMSMKDDHDNDNTIDDEDTKYEADDDDDNDDNNNNIITPYNDNNDNDSDTSSTWNCPLCTFENKSSAKICEMCAVGDIDTINQTRNDMNNNRMILKVDRSKPLNIETTLALLYLEDDAARKEGLRVVSKTCNKLLNNIQKLDKYGNLNYTKINQKLSKCVTALNLFYIAGFKKQTDDVKGERLIWNPTIPNIKSLTEVVEVVDLDESYMFLYTMAMNNGGSHESLMKSIKSHIEAKQNGNFICVCGKCHLK